MSVKPLWARRIAHFRRRLRLTQAQLAEQLQITQSAVSQWEKGDVKLSSEKWIALGNLLGEAGFPAEKWECYGQVQGFDADAVEEARSRANDPAAIPEVKMPIAVKAIRSRSRGDRKPPLPASYKEESERADVVQLKLMHDTAAAGLPREVRDKSWDRMIPLPAELVPRPDDTVCVRIVGDSMMPILQEGYYVAIEVGSVDPRQLVGEMVAASDPQGGVTIKWLRHDRESNQFMLVPQNTSPRHPVTILGPSWRIVGRVRCWLGMPTKRKL